MKFDIELKHTSFLILVKDEIFFSKKLIKYINSKKIKAEFIIADGSKKKQKKIFDKLKSKKKYYYFGEDTDTEKFFLKILKGIQKCSKKFIFFCDQDDLVNFKTIKKHENFLIKNNNYAAVRGLIYNFAYTNKKIKLLEKQYNNYKDSNIFLFRHLLNINFRAYYNLRRKSDLIKIYKLIVKYELNDFRSAEFINDILTLSFDRIKSFDKEISVLRWAGVKKRDRNTGHIINKNHKTRFDWFQYFFSKHKNLIIKILNEEIKILKNFYAFKLYILFTDIFYNFLQKTINRVINKFKKGKDINLEKKLVKFKIYEIIDEIKI